MAITRWDPFQEATRIRHTLNRLFDETLPATGRFFAAEGEHILPVDVYETAGELVVTARVPGAERDQVTVTAERGHLTIQAHLPSEAERPEAKDHRWHYRELWSGDVSRTITLPSTVDPDKATATFNNGVLSLRIPKVETAKPRQIPISVN